MSIPSASPPPATTHSATSAGSSSSTSLDPTANDTSSDADLGNLLAQSLGADAKAIGSSPLGPTATAPSVAAAASAASTTGASAAQTASAAAAALTAAQLQTAAHAGPQQTRADTAMTLSTPVGSAGWSEDLGAKVTWMAHQGIESASLHLSPEHLGPVQVTISMHDGQASVWFGATQPDTRTALQQSLPHLRQLFASQGLNLADAGVSREPPRGQERQSSPRASGALSGVTAVAMESSTSHSVTARGLGLVDTYV